MTRLFTTIACGAVCLGAATTAAAAERHFSLANPETAPAKAIKKAPAKAEASYAGFRTDVITSPQGETSAYEKVSSGYENFMSMLLPYTMSFSTDIVCGPDGDVYVKDPLSKYKTDSYIQGKAEGDAVSFQLPQTVYWNESTQDGLNLVAIDTQIVGGEMVWTYSDNQTLTLAKNADGSLAMVNEDENRLYAYVDIAEDEWSGYGDYAQNYFPAADKPIAAPDDAEWEKWNCEALNKQKPFMATVDVAFADGKVWIKGLCNSMPDATVEGYVADGTVTIPQREYLGDYLGRFPIYTLLGTLVDGEWGKEVQLLPIGQNYVLNFDSESMTMTAADPETVFLFNNGTAEEYNLDYWQNLQFSVAGDMSGTPANPYDLEAEEIPRDCLVFEFSMDPVSTTGTNLDPSTLAYRLFVDGSLWTFYKEEFPRGLPGGVAECTEIPSTFSNGMDIYKWSSTRFEVDLSVLGVEKIGVQAVYDYNGERTYSAIMTYDMATGEVTAIPHEGTEAEMTTSGETVATETFDALGRRTSAGAKGLAIVRRTLADGSHTTMKQMVR